MENRKHDPQVTEWLTLIEFYLNSLEGARLINNIYADQEQYACMLRLARKLQHMIIEQSEFGEKVEVQYGVWRT